MPAINSSCVLSREQKSQVLRLLANYDPTDPSRAELPDVGRCPKDGIDLGPTVHRVAQSRRDRARAVPTEPGSALGYLAAQLRGDELSELDKAFANLGLLVLRSVVDETRWDRSGGASWSRSILSGVERLMRSLDLDTGQAPPDTIKELLVDAAERAMFGRLPAPEGVEWHLQPAPSLCSIDSVREAIDQTACVPFAPWLVRQQFGLDWMGPRRSQRAGTPARFNLHAARHASTDGILAIVGIPLIAAPGAMVFGDGRYQIFTSLVCSASTIAAWDYTGELMVGEPVERIVAPVIDAHRLEGPNSWNQVAQSAFIGRADDGSDTHVLGFQPGGGSNPLRWVSELAPTLKAACIRRGLWTDPMLEFDEHGKLRGGTLDTVLRARGEPIAKALRTMPDYMLPVYSLHELAWWAE